jgi:acylphosphatase
MPRYHVTYRGRVQGVGFRATVRRIATAYPVSGWVRNSPDGTVELEAQGDKAAIDRFLGDIQREFLGYVSDEERSVTAECTDDTGFVVQY